MIVLHLLVALVISQRARRLSWIIIKKDVFGRVADPQHSAEPGEFLTFGFRSLATIVSGAAIAGLIAWFIIVKPVIWMVDQSPAPAPAVAHHEATDKPPPEDHIGLPWNQPFKALYDDLSGPLASTLALSGFVMVFAVLIFGGELNYFGRILAYMIMVMSVLVSGVSLLGALGVPVEVSAASSAASGPTRSTEGCIPFPPTYGCFP